MSNGADQLGLLLAFIVSVALIGAVVYVGLTHFFIALGALAFIGVGVIVFVAYGIAGRT